MSEIILNDSEFKKIKILSDDRNNKQFICKQYYQHDNLYIFLQLQSIKSKYFPRIYEINQIDGGFEVIEEYIEGKTLRDLMPLPNEDLILNYMIQLCEGLIELHKLNIVHRDLKPENIMISKDIVKIIDFDIAKRIKVDKNHDTKILGSIGYAAPEQYGFDNSDNRTDIYVFGNILNELFIKTTVSEKLYQGRCTHVIKKCTQLDPQKRYQKAELLLKDLQFLKSKKHRFTLPGFRSGKIWKMLVALIYYLIILYGIIRLEGENLKDLFFGRICCAYIFFMPVLVYTNYIDIQRYTPFEKYRLLGTLLLAFGGLVVLMIIFSIFFT